MLRPPDPKNEKQTARADSHDMKPDLNSVVSEFGASAKDKLSNFGARGAPEDQLRSPFEQLLLGIAEVLQLRKGAVVAVGESSVSDLKTRPDYAVTLKNILVGFIELKAPGKGADPRKFKDAHDKAQWQKLQSLPNLIYTDGNEFRLWQNEEWVGSTIRLVGDVESSGGRLQAPRELLGLFECFFGCDPIPPRSAKELAGITARLCRLLRDEVTEQLALKNEGLTALAADWRKLLFPEATDETFADGYAQAVTFGLLMARAQGIELAGGFDRVAHELRRTNSLIGAALGLLTDNAASQAKLKTSLGTLTRVLDAVHWPAISKGNPDAWLYFYEDFLEIYDNALRKRTGSYYTPPEVVGAIVRLVDDVLRSARFGLHGGLASSAVRLIDPALGTGTYLLGVLRKIAETVKVDEGEGAISGAITASMDRLVGFEMQLGPFAVAQLRIFAEIIDLAKSAPAALMRLFVTDTLGNPYDDEGWLPSILAPIASSRRDANKVKREETITVVIGNPPYKEKAKGRGGWVEGQGDRTGTPAPLADWNPPREWGLGVHAKHLRNLYVYFWRWATWKVYDHGPGSKTGIVCFISVAGFLNGPGFEKMREYLRRKCDDIWVIDCSPEGHQPEVNTRIFQGVQQPVCIVLTSRSPNNSEEFPAQVRFQALPTGHRTEKFEALGRLNLAGAGWSDCPSEWRAPFLPASTGAWATYPTLQSLFVYNGSGVQTKRTWVIAPDAGTLTSRWQRLIDAAPENKETLFHPTMRDGKPADRHIRSVIRENLPGYPPPPRALIDETGPCVAPIHYAFRSFDRQWIIPDLRVITQANAELWGSRSAQQIYITALLRTAPSSGPALTATGLVPDLDHYKGSFGGRVFPLWRDKAATEPNFPPRLLDFLSERYGATASADDLFAYIVAIAAHPAFTYRFKDDLSTPGLRIPITAEYPIFAEAARIGRRVVWLHTFGERMADAAQGRPAGPPRLRDAARPRIPVEGAIPQETDAMPDTIGYDSGTKRLWVGRGFVENVPPAVWNYDVSGKQVLLQWFSYRKADRERPIIGDRRPPSALTEIQPDHWLSEYTTELINLLDVLGGLVELEPVQAELLNRVCRGTTISSEELRVAGALEVVVTQRVRVKRTDHPDFFEE